MSATWSIGADLFAAAEQATLDDYDGDLRDQINRALRGAKLRLRTEVQS